MPDIPEPMQKDFPETKYFFQSDFLIWGSSKYEKIIFFKPHFNYKQEIKSKYSPKGYSLITLRQTL